MSDKKDICQKCYTCEQGIGSEVTIDDIRSGKVKLSNVGDQVQKCAICENCYTCEQGIDKSVTLEQMLIKKKELCRQCYTCQQGISPDITVDTPKGTKGSQVLTVGTGKSCVTRDEQCVNCYRCEQGVDRSVTADSMNKPEAMSYCWYIFPTNGCNLRCTYCYANNKPGNMSRDTMHDMLRWLFEKQPHKNLTCHFFGGEPMMMWDMIVDIVQLGSEMAKNNGYKVGWSMTTNGTLLNSEKLDWIEKNFKQNPFLLSIDGRAKTHDKHRIDAKGVGSHHLIPVDEILQRFPNIECRPTIKPDTVKDWFEDYRWLRNKGFKSIAIEPDYECEWTKKQLDDYRGLLKELGRYYVYAQKLEKPIMMKFIDSVRSQLRDPNPPDGRMCGVSWNCGAIDHRGSLYACQRYASYNEPEIYAIGDVWNGWDEFKLFETQLLFRSDVSGDVSKGFNCQTCDVRQYCMKGCNAANCKLNGNRSVAYYMYCVITKIEVGIALEVLSELGLLNIREKGGQHCRC